MPRPAIDEFLRIVPEKFADCLTHAPARSERELSAVLSAKHQFGEIKWDAVPMCCGSAVEPSIAASKIIGVDDYVFAEYPLFAVALDDVARWGAMAPDLVFVARNRDRLTLVECKLDSVFTHDKEPPNDQLSRYFAFLRAAPVQTRSLLLICPRCNYDWYAARLQVAIDHLAMPEIGGFITRWEDVFNAIEN